MRAISVLILFLFISPTANALDFLPNSTGTQLVGRSDPAKKFAARIEIFDANGISMGICSGTLVHARFVLTAAHCLTLGKSVAVTLGADIGDPDRLTVFSKEFSIPVEYQMRAHRILEDKSSFYDKNGNLIISLTDWSDRKNLLETTPSMRDVKLSGSPELAYDIGLIFLAQPIPPPFHPIKIDAAIRSAPAYGEQFAFYGFGRPDLYTSSAENYQLRETILSVTGRFTVNSGLDWVGLATFPFIGSTSCFGDSGGPLTVTRNSQMMVTAVQTSVFGPCTLGSGFVLTELHYSWLYREIAKRLEIKVPSPAAEEMARDLFILK